MYILTAPLKDLYEIRINYLLVGSDPNLGCFILLPSYYQCVLKFKKFLKCTLYKFLNVKCHQKKLSSYWLVIQFQNLKKT